MSWKTFADQILTDAVSLSRRVDNSPLFLVDPTATLSTNSALDLNRSKTDTTSIADTISAVDQKASVPIDALPEHAPPVTVVSAVDGSVTGVSVVNATTANIDSTANVTLSRRSDFSRSDFHQVFARSDSDRDCAIEGTAYLTYKLISNATYDENACINFCASVEGCGMLSFPLRALPQAAWLTHQIVFANLYYEFNNPLLDFVFSEKSNLKCSLFADFHIASEKTNCGGQQQQPKPAGLTYMQKSSGYAVADMPEPAVPAGFELVYGPTDGANNAPGVSRFLCDS
jgi:hypothetical protein